MVANTTVIKMLSINSWNLSWSKHILTTVYIKNCQVLPSPVWTIYVWYLQKWDESRYTASEMSSMRQTLGCKKWDRWKKNDIHHYQNNWRQHVKWMSKFRITIALSNYQPNGKILFTGLAREKTDRNVL